MIENQSRRDFLRNSVAVGGATIVVNPFPFEDLWAAPRKDTDNPLQHLEHHSDWMDGPGKAKFRYEGVRKVMGAKVYGRDYRAQDIPGWPQREVRVVILKADRYDQVFEGVDFSSIPKEYRPSKVITSKEFKKAGLKVPYFFQPSLFTELGQPADFLGQPVALLLFEDADAFLVGKVNYINQSSLIKWGKKQTLPLKGTYTEARYVRYAKPNGEDLYSAVHDSGMIQPPYQKPKAKGNANERGMYFADKIQKDIKSEGWQVVGGKYSTQTVDCCFMEPESGLCWWDAKSKTLSFVLSTQSPYHDAEGAVEMFSGKGSIISPRTIEMNACYIGGGFGGRDHSIFPNYLAIAAAFADGKPIRLIQHRQDQFQMGLKRHSCRIDESIAVDKNGKFQAIQASLEYSGGGKNNFSFVVPAVGAQNATSAYYLPRSDISFVGKKTRGVTAGSMRGFGTTQSMFAFESLIDEAAEKLKMDPIELRLRNVFETGMRTPQGTIPSHRLRAKEMMLKAQKHALWKNRDKIKKQRTNKDQIYGIGFAASMKSFGTNLDAILCEVAIDRQGRVEMKTNCTEMGNGAATTMPLATAAHLGVNASSINLGATTDFDVLKLKGKFVLSQEEQDRLAKDPHWVPAVSMGTAASASAYQQRHGVMEASKLLFETSIWRAASHLWDIPYNRSEARKAKWTNGSLKYGSKKALSMKALAEVIYKKNYNTGVMVHGYYRCAWAEADFKVDGEVRKLPLDALAFRQANGKYDLLKRKKVYFPPIANRNKGVDTYTPCAAIIGVAIDRKSGQVTVDEVQSFIDCGPIIHKDIVEGQNDGGVAMGMGQALYEMLPEEKGGAGEGGWNFGRYELTRYKHMPVTKTELHIIEAESPDEPTRGMAEVVMIPIAPAIANAVADATGKRFRDLPITAQQVKESLS
ncbi:xanthine dehydrogenase family protein molybdopterin-binding subunit [Pseudobacteriovorax antillogorgiicola]|uniref:CO or xanthine dehydrogenase, Mo-binding subunit n=1 Tax=Pseudobacteriovorax antillogorgiicola TaxID=1513793 RepID=A0A1Y6C2X7_9BACT|nr:molybdopterin cofactor-binding domain-containing protein [Pseudobacteriovorax antillogorgiicola]TCS49791.1 CO/xanthine dehydrogenase Mo-binding subunit [Pseudobacteriovorax antillogorgiicola]SMF42953.1 CO or xanthine dehydrogenase, Mo-binding subunit [Pseudobacteriovorax antillogorgiicola]